jgi:hypothetical protein
MVSAVLLIAKKFRPEQTLWSHNAKYKDSPRIFAVDDATRRLDNLAITPAFELWRL